MAKSEKTVLTNYTTSNLALKSLKIVGNMRRITIGHTRLTHGHFMSRSNQQPTYRNQTLPQGVPPNQRLQKYRISSRI